FFSSQAAPTSLTSPLSLHDALPVSCAPRGPGRAVQDPRGGARRAPARARLRCRARRVRGGRTRRGGGPRGGLRRRPAAVDAVAQDRKSTRLNSSHVAISYAVFCLKK